MAEATAGTIVVARPSPDALLVVAGEIDIATTPLLDEVVRTVIGHRPIDVLTIDTSDVSFIGSTGLAWLLLAQRLAEEADARFYVRAPSRAVVDLLRMTHLDERFEIV